MNRIITILSFLLFLPASTITAQEAGVTTEEVKFESEGVLLAGTIYRPVVSQAGVVIVHGSGETTRMGEFAASLAGHGISVLTYDKRGVGQSGGTYAGPEVGTNNVSPENLELLAKDAGAAVDFICSRGGCAGVGLLGFSQAGWIIPIAANMNSNVDFMVIFCGPVVSTVDQLIFQFWTNGDEFFWDNHTESDVLSHPLLSNPHRNKMALDEYQFEATDPYDALAEVSVPGLWLEGGRDIQVPVMISLGRLNRLRASGKPYEYFLFPELGHNVAFGGSDLPIQIAISWIKERAVKQ